MMRLSHWALAVLIAALCALPAGAQAGGKGQIVLLDDEWKPEMTMQGVEASVVTASGAGDDRVHSGTASLLLRNTEGAPQVRISGVTSLRPVDIGIDPQIKLWYRTDAWNGRWKVTLFTYFRAVSEHTFPLFEGDLNGGGPDGRLIADDAWHEAVATLKRSELADRIHRNSRLPLFLMLEPVSGHNIAHRTYVDSVVLVPGGPLPEVVETPLPEAELGAAHGRWTGPEPRPRPVYTGRERRLTPADDVQSALDTAQPGDVFRLAPGVYRQTLRLTRSGTAEAPIVLCAEQPGTVTVSGAADDVELKFGQVEGDLYAAPVPWHVRWVMADRRNLVEYEDLDRLKSFIITGHDSRRPEPGPPEGFVWQDGMLYVRLLQGQDPSQADIQIHRPYAEAETDASGTAFWRNSMRRTSGGRNIIVQADYVVIDGLRLHMAPEAAIEVTGEHVTIRDCLISAAHRGIRAGDSDHLTVEHCEFNAYPAYQWVRWGQSAHPERRGALWNSIYNTNLCATFIAYTGESTRVLNNLVYECFDGIHRHVHEPDRKKLPELASEFAYNAVMSCGDECVELDSTGLQNLRMHHNVFVDALALLALSPVQGGALTIDHNIVYASPDYGLMPCVLFKFDCPWIVRNSAPTRDCVIAHNTLINGRAGLYWTGENHSYRDMLVTNNIMWVRLSRPWRLPDFAPRPTNLYAGPDVKAEHMPGVILASSVGFRVEPTKVSLHVPRLLVVPLQGLEEEPPDAARVETPVDFHLTAGSPAVDAGENSPALATLQQVADGRPDLGAIEFGTEWLFPRPGPRWATGDREPWRPPLPPSLEPRWVGLDR